MSKKKFKVTIDINVKNKRGNTTSKKTKREIEVEADDNSKARKYALHEWHMTSNLSGVNYITFDRIREDTD